MSSTLTGIITQFHHKFTFLLYHNKTTICKPFILLLLFLFLFYLVPSNHLFYPSPLYFANFQYNDSDSDHSFSQPRISSVDDSRTNISHLVFVIAGSMNSWKSRKQYIKSWWQPNATLGYLFLDREPTEFLPWPSKSPPYRIYEDTSKYRRYNRHPMRHAIRMLRVILQAFREEHDERRVRWYVMADDDTILFVENLVEVLSGYDHRKYYYIGQSSESVLSNFDHSFEMAFGGGGYALSYPLVEALVKNMDACIKRYPFLFGSDHMMQSCVADLGVSLTHERGFHQVDLLRDISGYLSAHPQSPFLSLHHLDIVDPIFPSMTRPKALNHLMKAAKADQSRLLQQTICYRSQTRWSISVSWGYSAQLYESVIPPSLLERPLETFIPWRKRSRQPYMFNTRWLSNNPCEMPHIFYFDYVKVKKERIVTGYTRRMPRTLPACPVNNGNGNASDVFKIEVISPTTKYGGVSTGYRMDHPLNRSDVDGLKHLLICAQRVSKHSLFHSDDA